MRIKLTIAETVMTSPDRIREARARRALARRGLRLNKSRTRNTDDPTFGRFNVVDPEKNLAIAGFAPWAYSLDLDEVEAFVREA